jgi:hypothetical protein
MVALLFGRFVNFIIIHSYPFFPYLAMEEGADQVLQNLA